MFHGQIHPYGLLIVHFLVSGLAVFITAKLVPGIKVKNFVAAVFAAIAIGIANATVYWILLFLSLPLILVTLGLFLFVVNAAVLRICAALIPGFQINGWISAVFGGIVLSLLNSFLHYVFI